MDGRLLSFRLAGINNQNFIMADRETGSWWQQVTGIAIQGPLKGRRLNRVFHDELTFQTWSREWPGGRVLLPAPDSAWIRNWQEEEQKTPTRPVRVAAPLDQRLPPREVVVGIELGGETKAWPLARILSQFPIHDRLGDRQLVILVGEDGKSVRAFETVLPDQTVELVRLVEGRPGEYTDVATGSTWDFRGRAIAGPLAGRKLAPVYVLKDYWFDWKTYHPATGLYDR